MSLAEVRRIADAVLYEGYILYPYRASAQKNHSRWQFGVLMPPGYTAADPSENSTMRAECVFEHHGQPTAEITVRFLQVQRRRTDGPAAGVPAVWDEAVEREVTVTASSQVLLGDIDMNTPFTVPGGEDTETLAGARVARRREPLTGTVSVRATPLPGPWQAARLTVQVTNESDYPLPSETPDVEPEGAPPPRELSRPGAIQWPMSRGSAAGGYGGSPPRGIPRGSAAGGYGGSSPRVRAARGSSGP
jgi:hypothetical protein